MARRSSKQTLISFLLIIGLAAVFFGAYLANQNNTPPPDGELEVGTYESFNNQYDIDNNNSGQLSLSINNKILSWQQNIARPETQYYVVYFSNTTDPETVVTSDKAIDVSALVSDAEDIVCFRVGQMIGGKLSLSDIQFYNPVDQGSYSTNVFYFMGRFGDHYVSDITELAHVIHHNFVMRNTSISLKLSEDYTASLKSNGLFSTITSGFQTEIEKVFNNEIVDTMSVAYSFSIKSHNNGEVAVTIDYKGGKDVIKAMSPVQVQDTLAKPYYLTKTFEKRSSDYDNFATDDKLFVRNVNSSEELFWAIEDGLTPIFNSKTSSGYLIYEKAKNVLRQIISDDMTDYEKVLSIFDFITYSTVYDKKIASSDYMNYFENPKDVYTMYGAFYLEGVFNDFVAVCDGYSKAFSVLSNMEGIKAVRIAGDAGGGHAWNKVMLNDRWYVVDITWTELETEDYVTSISTEFLSHKFFLVSDKEIATHQPHKSQVYKNFAAEENYSYYFNTYFSVNDNDNVLVVDNINDANVLLDYLWQTYKSSGKQQSVEILFSQHAVQNWATWVKSYKAAYNFDNPEDKFENDILKIYDGTYIGFSDSYNIIFGNYNGKQFSVSIVQIRDTKLNLQNNS